MSQDPLDLTGEWRLADADGAYEAPLHLPGDIITALHEAQHIPDPYWGQNEYDLAWICERDWVARRSFTITHKRDYWSLYLSKLDCVAELRINGALVLEASNAFRPHEVEISDHVKLGENEIEIRFLSPVKEAAKRQAAQPFRVPYHEGNCPIPNGNMLRKQQCDFGWDWNIALAPSGLYGEIRVCGAAPTDLRKIRISQQPCEDGIKVHVSFDCLVCELEPLSGTVTLCGDTQVVTQPATAVGQIVTLSVSFLVEDPRLWQPNGHGTADLYDFSVTLGGQMNKTRIALRDIKLRSTPDASDGAVGRSFGFEVNGKPVFARGANWIPADALGGRICPKKVRALLQSAKDANMNMIRVWGGGRYEPDWFYEICDELGLLVWQDAMFSCNLYPADDDFLDAVHEEIVYQTNRLHHRVALWCGDNELIGALTWFDESIKDRDRYLVAYDRLNRTIERAVKTHEFANWWPSSPSPGPLSFGDAWHDDSSGDMHFWSVWHEGRDFEHYRDIKPRFCSEFGFQSYPSMDVIRSFAEERDFNIAAPVMESHQKNKGGNARIAETMFRYFRFPNSFENFVYLSQIQQGIAIKTAVDYWRSLKPHCMGALYWQLNDTWPCASWSSLDYGGGWKALHHMARRFYAPVSVVAYASGDCFRLVGINDTAQAVELNLTLEAVTLAGARRPLSQTAAKLPTDGAPVLAEFESTSLNEDEFLYFTWDYDAGDGQTGDGQTGDGQKGGADHLMPRRYKTYDFPDPNIKMAIRDQSITLMTERPAHFVHLSADVAGRFSDNAFLLMPGKPHEVTFKPATCAVPSSISFRHLQLATAT